MTSLSSPVEQSQVLPSRKKTSDLDPSFTHAMFDFRFGSQLFSLRFQLQALLLRQTGLVGGLRDLVSELDWFRQDLLHCVRHSSPSQARSWTQTVSEPRNRCWAQWIGAHAKTESLFSSGI
ncbi:hypothetical protein TB2_031196 [Malus domestica]